MAVTELSDEVLGEFPSRRALASFVETIYDDLEEIVDRREVLFLVLPQRTDQESVQMVRQCADAWVEVAAARGRVTAAVLPSNGVGPPPEGQQLLEAGLMGHQLHFKLAMYYNARSGLIEALAGTDVHPRDDGGQEPAAATPPSSERLPWPRKLSRLGKSILKWLARVLAFADTILGSLASVIQISEGLKEFKEAIEKLCDDSSELVPD